VIVAGALVLIVVVLLGLALWPPEGWWLWRQVTRSLRRRVRPHRNDPRIARRSHR
jgi:hypothetical protein